MFRWPERLAWLAYTLVFLVLPALCVLSYLWVRGVF
jgi:hypothetical protein